MKLAKEITIIPPSYLMNDQIVHPNPLKIDSLKISYTDIPIDKLVYATIENFPAGFLLWQNDDYINIGDWTQAQADARIQQFLGNSPHTILSSLFPPTGDTNPNGAGSILSGMLSTIGINSSPTCSCKKHIKEMNLRGPDWCESNLDTIVGWLKNEAEKRKLPFVEMVAKAIVRSAIKKSRRLLKKQEGLNV